MVAAVYNFIAPWPLPEGQGAPIEGPYIEQGATWAWASRWLDEDEEPIDLSEYTARMAIKTTPTAGSALVSLTTENNRIILNEETGSIRLNLTAAETAAIPASSCAYWYDLELVHGDVVERIIQGRILVHREITT